MNESKKLKNQLEQCQKAFTDFGLEIPEFPNYAAAYLDGNYIKLSKYNENVYEYSELEEILKEKKGA